MPKVFHKFHMVDPSPWPLMTALSFLGMTISFISMLQGYPTVTNLMVIFTMMLLSFQWWRDIIRESLFQGCHSFNVSMGLKMGMILFILSEIMFFFSFFWAYFHSSISPSIEIGMNWPPKGIVSFNPLNIPLLNTIILLSSGVSVTWSHHSILKNNLKTSIISLSLTIMMGVYFSILQAFEYWEASFSMSDSIYGSIFFMATGFHGIHVLIGTIFLMVNLIRIINLNNSSNHTNGFEMAAWYWHFVDIVWLFLYMSIYWWGM